MNLKHIILYQQKILNDLIKVFKKLDNDKKIKVIILEGAGKGFSAGHNLKEVRGLKKKKNIKNYLIFVQN
jgi:enoyl-CoA hydratase/carnithine racemase